MTTPPPRREHTADSDRLLAEQITQRLAATAAIKADDVQVAVEGGRVELRGYVESFAARLMCTEVAEAIAGQGSVSNELRVRPFEEGWQLDPAGPVLSGDDTDRS